MTADLAGYYVTQFVRPYLEMGIFDSIRLPVYRIAMQILDSINNAALAGLTLDEAQERLIQAWGGQRPGYRVNIYQTVMTIARQYQGFCLERGLLDFALQIRLLVQDLLDTDDFQEDFKQTYHFLVADNVEEMGALAHDFIFWCMEYVQKTIIIYDRDGGFRTFLGADPAHAYQLAEVCSDRAAWEKPVSLSAGMAGIVSAFDVLLQSDSAVETPSRANRPPMLRFASATFYPQMIDHCVTEAARLIRQKNVPPERIAIVAPYLSDALLFALQSRLEAADIPTISRRPSRPLIREQSVQMVVTFLRLYLDDVQARPQTAEVAYALQTAIEGLDPVRASLLTQIAYRNGELSGLEHLSASAQTRLTEALCLRYGQIQSWFAAHSTEAESSSPADFISRFIEEVIVQPGFAGHSDASFRHPLNNLITAAQHFTEAVYPGEQTNRADAMREFIHLTVDGLISLDIEPDRVAAVLIAPAYTFLTRNLRVDYQFWLDIGDHSWIERLEQPLTNPYVLRRDFPAGSLWTDDLETAAQEARLRSLILGLLRRCDKGVFVEACDISAGGYEQRGRLAFVFQQMFDRSPHPSTP
ncbi:MAG: hypothetical protein HXY41_12300 [Chloroflexi bacterium]|nr:hypothetical protein [Chloroflexota bacterium]